MAPVKKKPRLGASSGNLPDGSSGEPRMSHSATNQRRSQLPEVKPDGIIRWEIENFSELTRRESPTEEIYGVPWNLKADAQMTPPYASKSFGVYIRTNGGSESPLWQCKFKSKIFFINRDPENTKIQITSERTNNYINNSQGWVYRNRWNRFLDPNMGFIEDNKLTVEVWIYVTNFTGMTCYPRFDFSVPSVTRSDVVLIVEGNKVHVNRQMLAFHSEFFQSLFFGHFVEKGKKEIELKDIVYEEFIELLHVVYPSCKKIRDETFEYLLKLGDRFQITCVIDRIEDFIITSSKIPTNEKLEIAVQYRLTRLGEHCSTLTPHEFTFPQKFITFKDIDFSASGETHSDVTLIIDGKAVHVCKKYLGLYSPIFYNLFFGNSKDRRKTEFNLNDVVYEEFNDLLHLIYASSKKITDDSAEYLLKLGHRFQIACVIDRAEAFIIGSGNISNLNKLRMAEEYKLFKLQEHCFSKLMTPRDFKIVKQSSIYKTLSSDTKVALFERVLKRI